jgi:uncharacterized protein
MIIKISSLQEKLNTLIIDGDVSELKLLEPFYGKYDLKLEIDKAHNQLVLKAFLKLNCKFSCDRCGNQYDEMLNVKFEQVYLFGVSCDDDDDSDVIYLPFDADKIDISKELFDYSVLALPMKKLCDNDCKGICPRCGTNLNINSCECKNDEIDPRWKPLLDIKE